MRTHVILRLLRVFGRVWIAALDTASAGSGGSAGSADEFREGTDDFENTMHRAIFPGKWPWITKNRFVFHYKAFLRKKIRFQDQKIRFRDQNRDQKRVQTRFVIPYKAFLKEIKIPGPKNKIPGPKKGPKKIPKLFCHSLESFPKEKLRFRVQNIRFRDQKRDQKRVQNRSVIPYKAFLRKIKIPGLKNKIPGPKKEPKKRPKSFCHSL